MNLSDIVLKHNKSVVKSRGDVDITIDGLSSPVVLSNMETCQNETVLKIFKDNKLPYVYHRLCPTEQILNFVRKSNYNTEFTSISVGVSEEYKNLLRQIKQEELYLDWLTIDVALIYNEHFEEYIKWVRGEFPNVYLIAGNFNGIECADWLHDLGVDCGKANIGTSALCRTRQYTGFGTDILSFYDTCNKSKIDLMFDGGLTILDEERGEIAYGDIFKVVAMGAKWVMSSSLFRWAHELGDNGFITQYGNSTARAKGYDRNVEGAVKQFKTQYVLKEQLNKIKENLQSSVSYAGYSSLHECCGKFSEFLYDSNIQKKYYVTEYTGIKLV